MKHRKKMLQNTPAMYKKAYPFLKEEDSLALANVQMHLEKAYKNFFRNPKIGFPKFKSKHRSRKSYTYCYGFQAIFFWNITMFFHTDPLQLRKFYPMIFYLNISIDHICRITFSAPVFP